MTRHEQREQIFKLLFRVEYHTEEDMPEQVRLFFDTEEYQGNESGAQRQKDVARQKDVLYIKDKVDKIREKITEIDEMINEKSEGWDLGRIGKVELTILRLAVFEILYDDDIPAGVAINEGVELAKTYGQDTSGGFVNAILAKFV